MDKKPGTLGEEAKNTTVRQKMGISFMGSRMFPTWGSFLRKIILKKDEKTTRLPQRFCKELLNGDTLKCETSLGRIKKWRK